MANNNSAPGPSSSNKWYFTKEQLENTPSKKHGYDHIKELSYRQQTANFIQDMGQRLKVSQLCINTAIVYMHRFYVFHSFADFPWHQMAAAALFLAAKVEEQPRKLEYVIRVANMCRYNRDVNVDVNSERYIAQSQDLVFNENVLLQTLGFDVAIDHPHTHVVRCCHLVRASKDLAQSSYFLASNSLHLTTMCLQYKPTVVACFCIHLACKWSSWKIPLSSEEKEWFLYVDPTVTADLLRQLTEEFLSIFESCPSRLKEKIMAIGDSNVLMSSTPTIINSPFDIDVKRTVSNSSNSTVSSSGETKESSSTTHRSVEGESHKHGKLLSVAGQRSSDREYKDKKFGQQSKSILVPNKPSSSHNHHHHYRPSTTDGKPKSNRPLNCAPNRPEPIDILREASIRDSAFGIAAKEPDPNTVSKTEASNFLDTNRSSELGRPKVSDVSNKVPTTELNSMRSDMKCDTHDNAKSPIKSMNAMPKSKSSNSVDIIGKYNTSTSDPKLAISRHQTFPQNKRHFIQQHNGSSNTSLINDNLMPTMSERVRNDQSLTHTLYSHSDHVQISKKAKDEVDAINDTLHNRKAGVLSPSQSPKKIVKRDTLAQSRLQSAAKDAELRPVLKKIDQVEGFENILHDVTIGINQLRQVPDIITPITDADDPTAMVNYSKGMKPPDIIPPIIGSDYHLSQSTSTLSSQPIVNGMETNPMLISSLLKEVPSVSHLPVIATNEQLDKVDTKSKEHHHHKSKKKNKEKHKHKDKSNEEKSKKKKHKEKHKHKTVDRSGEEDNSKKVSEPIKIKIHKDKIQPPQERPLKIKISKDIIKKESTESGSASSAVTPSGIGLKIKIPKEMLNNCSSAGENSGGNGRKRTALSGGDGEVPGKHARLSSHAKNAKPNGRNTVPTKLMEEGDSGRFPSL